MKKKIGNYGNIAKIILCTIFILIFCLPVLGSTTDNANKKEDHQDKIILKETIKVLELQDNKPSDSNNSSDNSCEEYQTIKINEEPLFCIDSLPPYLIVDDEDPSYLLRQENNFKNYINLISRNINILKNQKHEYISKNLSINRDSLKIYKKDFLKIYKKDSSKIYKKESKYYYYLPLLFSFNNKYFQNDYKKNDYKIEVLSVGGYSAKLPKETSNPQETIKDIKKQLVNMGEKIKERIGNLIDNYHSHYLKDNSSNNDSKSNDSSLPKEELSSHAVTVGTEVIFYINTWNNGFSPKERASYVNSKIEEIIKGKIDIQDLGIFEEEPYNSTDSLDNDTSEEETQSKSKIIKIISDSKDLAEKQKVIMEVSENDAIIADKKNAEKLAQEYLLKINESISKYKNNSVIIKDRGYPIIFFDDKLKKDSKPLYFIKYGLETGIHQSSFRAKRIYKKIENYAQSKFLFRPLNKLIVAYLVDRDHSLDRSKGLCILTESLNTIDKDYYYRNSKSVDNSIIETINNQIDKKFEFIDLDSDNVNSNSNSYQSNNRLCEFSNILNRQTSLAILYSDEISNKLKQREWELTEHSRNLGRFEYTGSLLTDKKSIVYMNISEPYNIIQQIIVNELDPILHPDIESKEELAIFILNKIESEVVKYRFFKSIGFGFWLSVLLIFLANKYYQFIHCYKSNKIYHFIDKSYSCFFKIFIEPAILFFINTKYSAILFVTKGDFSEKDKDLYDYNKDSIKEASKAFSLIKRLIPEVFCLLFVIFHLIYFTPVLDSYINNKILVCLAFFQEQKNNIFTYISSEIPIILFILVLAYIFEKLLSFIVYSRINYLSKKGENKSKEYIPIKSKSDISKLRAGLSFIRLFIAIFTIVLIYPHLPASDTIYFKGLSGVVILAFTWSASSAIADIVAGFFLIYGKSITVGNIIEVGDVFGEVLEQNLLYHRIVTAKKCVITIPNSSILNNFTTNYSVLPDDLIIHVQVGFGYDIKRSIVEEVLLNAAKKCTYVEIPKPTDLRKIGPFVNVFSLDDYVITYELNVHIYPRYIKEINNVVYPKLYRKIQDECNDYHIEMISPSVIHYRNIDTTQKQNNIIIKKR